MAYIQKSFLKTGALSNKNENNIVEDIKYLISNKGQDITLTDGTLDPAVQSALYELPGLITSSDGTVYKRYKLEGVIKMTGTGTFTNFAIDSTFLARRDGKLYQLRREPYHRHLPCYHR